MSNQTYIYALYIATTAEKLWQALTSNEFIKQYWPDWRIESDWTVGSPVRYFAADGSFYSQGEVVESNPPATLSYTWPEPEGQKTLPLPERITWQITPSGPGTVKLKLIHEQLSEQYFQGVSEGWPLILSSLKSLVETGKPLNFFERGNTE